VLRDCSHLTGFVAERVLLQVPIGRVLEPELILMVYVLCRFGLRDKWRRAYSSGQEQASDNQDRQTRCGDRDTPRGLNDSIVSAFCFSIFATNSAYGAEASRRVEQIETAVRAS
jgi:hypothetical protein